MTDADVESLLETPEIAAIDADAFPNHTPVSGILRNDTRIVEAKPGDIIVREGDYGNSAFLILDGALRVVLAPGLPANMLGRQSVRRKGFFEALAQLWRNKDVVEARDPERGLEAGLRLGGDPTSVRVFLQDVPVVLDQHQTARLETGALFGELAALGRVPRTATVFAEVDSRLLEIRWQGLREFRRFDEGWRRRIDENYRRNALSVHLTESPLFENLDTENLDEVAAHTLFETYGSFDWHVTYQKMRAKGAVDAEHEPVIAKQGDYPDGLLMIRAGFARVSVNLGKGLRTISYLGAGDMFGLADLYALWKGDEERCFTATLTAIGYVDIIRVPAQVLAEHVFPDIGEPMDAVAVELERPLEADSLIEWALEQRFINGTKAMLIDINLCVRCDDCVRACASTHNGNPRFTRQGRTFDHWMVANACMHCADPVCMIGCPTGAIHRSVDAGSVLINDDTCIGCGICASSCPYGNIRTVEINDVNGSQLRDPDNQRPILKATKCDLCSDQPGGPACVRACPHNALRRVDFQGEGLSDQWLV
ncbi:MAG: cyclic nucleotide-binding domain-containing protein [Alphaproteobacteria bacterium]|jgi:Fe-S-cluster-containing dehydrogenase component/CRP-like cAMP-binding protein|nr:cyclic nucleotide-binding domain-containing protein [Alphaproteobacteria bacterium]